MDLAARRTWAALGAAAMTAACGGGGGGDTAPVPLAPGTHNTGLGVSEWAFDGEWIVATVPERLEDRNGDGDTSDLVLAAVHAPTGRVKNLAQAAENLTLADGIATFVVPESAQGGHDLNGDGDARDGVLFVHDLARGRTRDLRLAVGGPSSRDRKVGRDGNELVFSVSELDQGETDLNGDGDTDDRLVYTLALPDGRPLPLGLETQAAPLVGGGRVAVARAEDGRLDLNNDGDTRDDVLVVHDLALGTTRNLGRAVPLVQGVIQARLEGALLVATVLEATQGMDLNGDGDSTDAFVEVHDLDTGASTLSPEGAVVVAAGPELVAARVPELAFEVGDRNGDGDVEDDVLWVLDRRSGTATLGTLALPRDIAPGPSLDGRLVAFAAGEREQGRDLDGDGDAEDDVLALFDGARGVDEATTHALGWGYELLALDPRSLLFPAPDAGDVQVRHAMALDRASGIVRPLGLPTTRMDLQEGRALVWVPEEQAGDVNGDGRLVGSVLVVRGLAVGETYVTGIVDSTAPPWQPGPVMHGDLLVASVSELALLQDLDGDGLLMDSVLQIVRLR